jgi:hypothetical protein
MKYAALVLSTLMLLQGCAACDPPPGPPDPPGEDAGPPPPGIPPFGPGFDAGPLPDFAISTRGRLVWKRYRALEQDLVKALEVDAATMCNELGQFSCVDLVHLVPLGGNDPIGKGQYVPAAAPQVTTPIAVERVVMAACGRRVDDDAAATPAVFTSLDLTADSVTEAEADATADVLYDRLLMRDPLETERDALRELRTDDDGADVSARDFAKMACLAVGTTTEFLFQ